MDKHETPKYVNVEQILKELEPKIKKSLRNTYYQNREDLEQELKLKIVEMMNKNKFNYTPGFWELAEKLR